MCRADIALACAALLAGGCATVEPRADYDAAGRMIAERTSAQLAYDPAIDEQVEGRVADLLAGGLTVDEAVHAALLNNRAFQALFAEIGASRADVVQSGLLTNPSLAFSLMFPEAGGLAKLNFGFAQQIAELWQIPARKQAAEAQLERTILTAVQRAIELRAEVKSRYYRLAALKRSREVTREQIALFERSLDLTRIQFEAGEVAAFDVNLSRAGLIDVQLSSLKLEQESRIAEIELARSLGLSGRFDSIELTESIPGEPVDVPDDAAMVEFAAAQRLDLRAAELAILAATHEFERQRMRVFPDVSLGVELERPDRRALPERKLLADTARASIREGALTAPEIQSRGERRFERSQLVDVMLGPTITLMLPVWDQNQAQIYKAAITAWQREKEYEDLLDAVASDVRRALASLRWLGDQERLLRESGLPQAREQVNHALSLFQAGERSLLFVIESQRSLLLRELAYVDLLRDHALADVELERALGGRAPRLPTTQPATSR